MPQKIAILGGGMGALSAAFALSDQEEWRQRYDITVYQMGWRLGGKGASGRNKEKRDRIEEHGLHIWMGMYENAFRVMQACYAELGRQVGQDPLATWDEAFKKHSFCTMMEPVGNTWASWSFNVPTNQAVPGQGGLCLSIFSIIRRLIQWIHETHRLPMFGAGPTELLAHLPLQRARDKAEALADQAHLHPPEALESIVKDLDQFRKTLFSALWGWLHQWETASRRRWILVDLAVTLVVGLIADRVTTSFDPLDQYDFREWLQRHGASPAAVQSAPIRCIYELVFAYEKGDPHAPRLGAGVALRFVLRSIFTYQGAFIYEMQAGMGDVVFAPLYLVLQKRGVKFKFFHRVENLGLSADKQSIATLRVSRQATMKDGDYRPLVKVKGLDCWPALPQADQFIDSERLAFEKYQQQGIEVFESAWSPWQSPEVLTLQAGKDFDLVVLGISLGALKYLCGELIASRDAWKNMVSGVPTVQTQGFQLWLNRSAEDMGWKNVPEKAILDSYRDSWADFSHLIPVESWSDRDHLRSIAYFCNALQDAPLVPDPKPDPGFQLDQKQRVKDISLQYLKTGLTTPFWPDAVNPQNPQELDWNALVDATGGAGELRFDYQFWRANIDPTERYVQSVPGSTQYRLKADQSGFANLFLAGDWLKTGINAGCIEAATMGGLQASRAISGHPQEVFGETDFCPQSAPQAAIRAAGQPLYIKRGGEQVPSQPVALKGVDFYSFALKADAAVLQQLCDRFLNVPGQDRVRYHALIPVVLFTVANIARVQSLSPGDSVAGWSPETDASFWVPLVAVQRFGSGWSLPRLVWFQPYLFVDNAWAIAAGREIYGFAKELATFPNKQSWQFHLAAAGMAAPSFSITALATKRFGINSQAIPATLLEVRPKAGAAPAGTAGTWGNQAEAVADFSMVLGKSVTHPLTGQLIDVAPLLGVPGVHTVFLKQFRDVQNGSLVCYQAIVEATANIVDVTAMHRLAGSYVVAIRQFDSHPMVADLGLGGPATDPVELEATAAFYLNFDFTIGNGEIIWKA
jgi:uncharacterized protein with NAD-binding domain and iron-sulfur cluster